MKQRVYIAIPTLDGRIEAGLTHLLCLAERMNADERCPWWFQKELFVGYSPVDWMRNAIFQSFLESDCDRLWMLDADILPPPSAFEILTLKDPIVAGQVTGYKMADDGRGIVLQVCAYEWQDGTLASIIPTDEDREIGAAGAGCLVVGRDVLEDERMRVCADPPESERDDDWAPAIYQVQTQPWGRLVDTGDVDFCRRAVQCGYRIRLWGKEMFGQRESLDLRDVHLYGERCARAAALEKVAV